MPDRIRPLNVDPEAPPFLSEEKVVLIYILKVPDMSNFILASAEELRTSGSSSTESCLSLHGRSRKQNTLALRLPSKFGSNLVTALFTQLAEAQYRSRACCI